MDAQRRLVEDKSKALELREQEVARLLPQISAREQRLVDRESEQTRRDVDLAQRKLDLDRRAAALPETESRLEARRRELEQKSSELLRRESEITMLESAAATGSTTPSPALADLSGREVKLQQFKAILDEQNLSLGRKARENAERARAAEESLRQAAEREAALAARELALQQREADVPAQAKGAAEARTQYQTAAQEYENRLTELARQQSDLASKAVEFERGRKVLTDRESALVERERRFASTRDEIDTRERAVSERESRLDAGEAEAGLRRATIATAGPVPTGVLPAYRQVAPTGAVTDLSASPIPPGADSLRASTPSEHPDRKSTGIPRLDSLLLGGLPPQSHLVLLGDAFVGKEIVLYSFIAEGLKRGEPAILLTAARSPEEVAASLGVVLPQFREYEQLGLVTWIDASGTKGAGADHRVVVAGSDDRAGILSNLVKAAKAFEDAGHPTMRFGFLGLSAILAHGDERLGFSFLQNVVGIFKPRDVLAMYSLEGGAVSDAQVEALLSRMDGAIAFRQDRDKTFLAVRGLGEVQTHDWVECRATNRALIVGSFALERIR